ncbi:MAG: glycosyltransferase family 2 protein [Puniceicoccales bacterium]
MPWASVIIPTNQRPELLQRAIKSVLAQSMDDWELLVVSDGPDPQNRASAAPFMRRRVRYIELPQNRGANAARNEGIRQASGEWIAFLDDDDEWLPEKLAACRAFIESNQLPPCALAHQIVSRSDHGEELMPRRIPDSGEPFPDYSLRRREMRHGEGHVLTSTVMAHRDICRRVPWGGRHIYLQENDWLTRVTCEHGYPWHVLLQPLAIWHCESDRARISTNDDRWRFLYSSLRRKRHLISREAYAAGLLTVVADAATSAHNRDALPRIVREAFTNGSPGWRELMAFSLITCFPRKLRKNLRQLKSPRTPHGP